MKILCEFFKFYENFKIVKRLFHDHFIIPNKKDSFHSFPIKIVIKGSNNLYPYSTMVESLS